MSTKMIVRSMNDVNIGIRVRDDYVNATQLCQANRKRAYDYSRLDVTKAFVKELSSETGIPVSQLIQSVKGGFPEFQGTWVHPLIAYNLAQRISRWD